MALTSTALRRSLQEEVSEDRDPLSIQRAEWPPLKEGMLQFAVGLEQRAAIVSLVREFACGGSTVRRAEVWRVDHGDEEKATDAYAALSERQPDLAFWSVWAVVLGGGRLGEMTEALVHEFVEQREFEAQQREEARLKTEEKLAAATRLGVWYKEKKGRLLLNLHRGAPDGKPLWSISFNEAWERERFLDWLKQQTHRFEQIAIDAERIEAGELERGLLKEMLVTEQRVKKQGLGAGGRRPLRFWRGDL